MAALSGCSHSWDEYAPTDGPTGTAGTGAQGGSAASSGAGGAGASGGMSASSSSSSGGIGSSSSSGVSTGGAGGSVNACDTPVFVDDFSGDLSSWMVDGGTWAIENGALAQTDRAAINTLIYVTGNDVLADQRIQALTTLVAGDPSGAIELVGRVDPQNPGNRYWCAFQPSDGWLVIRVDANGMKVDDIVDFQVDLADTPGYVATDPHMMHFDVVGTQLHCWIEGVVGAEAIVSDGTYDSGTFGAKTYIKHARFDDFTVCP